VTARVAAIYRYPVKGMTGVSLSTVPLTADEGLPHDRRFAIARADARLDPEAPAWRPKERFVMLMRDADLARLRVEMDVEAGTMVVDGPDGERCTAPFGTRAERAPLEAFLGAALGPRGGGPVRLVEAGALSFTDVPENCVSLINLGSVQELAARMGQALDPLRFRANLYVDGLAPWREFDWVGRVVQVGDVRLKVIARIPRCAATGVNPATGERDLNVVKALKTHFKHTHMGVYATVTAGGVLRSGAGVEEPEGAGARSRLVRLAGVARFYARQVGIALSRRR
jgi:hypothetical protein